MNKVIKNFKKDNRIQQNKSSGIRKMQTAAGGPIEKFKTKDINGEIIIPHPFLYKKKQGGKMNTLWFLKNGSGIHIKKKNRGKFTEYCGGEVTDACIRKAKASGNPTLVKRATFAANARKWKH